MGTHGLQRTVEQKVNNNSHWRKWNLLSVNSKTSSKKRKSWWKICNLYITLPFTNSFSKPTDICVVKSDCSTFIVSSNLLSMDIDSFLHCLIHHLYTSEGSLLSSQLPVTKILFNEKDDSFCSCQCCCWLQILTSVKRWSYDRWPKIFSINVRFLIIRFLIILRQILPREGCWGARLIHFWPY